MNIANSLSYMRIGLVGVGWVLALLEERFVLGLILIGGGLTDTLDGMFARKLGTASAYGAWLDSFADAFIIASAFAWALLLTPVFQTNAVLAVAAVLSQVLAYIVAMVKLGRLAALHLMSSKIMAVIAYLFIAHALIFGMNTVFFYITTAVIIYSGLDEIQTIFRTSA